MEYDMALLLTTFPVIRKTEIVFVVGDYVYHQAATRNKILVVSTM